MGRPGAKGAPVCGYLRRLLGALHAALCTAREVEQARRREALEARDVVLVLRLAERLADRGHQLVLAAVLLLDHLADLGEAKKLLVGHGSQSLLHLGDFLVGLAGDLDHLVNQLFLALVQALDRLERRLGHLLLLRSARVGPYFAGRAQACQWGPGPGPDPPR